MHKHLNTRPHVDMHACVSHMGCEDIWLCGEAITFVKWRISDFVAVHGHFPRRVAFSLKEVNQVSLFWFSFFLHFYCISFMASPPLWSILKYLDSTMGINWYYVQTFMIHRGGIVLTLVIIPWLFLLKNGLWHWTISEIFLKNSVEKGRRFPKNTWQVIGRPICQSTSIMGELQPIRSTVGEQY